MHASLKAVVILFALVTWTCALDCIPDADGEVNLSNGELGAVTSLSATTLFECTPYLVNITSLDLSNNSIAHIENDSFVQFFNLANLNLSHNDIQSLDKSTFNALRNLQQLDLSYNYLTKLEAGLIDNYNLHNVWFNNNNISYVEPGIVNNITQGIWYFNLNYNKLTYLDPWPYLTFRSYSKHIDRVFDIQHNEITELTNHMNWTFDLKYPFEIEVNAQYNKISTISPDTLRQYDPSLTDDSAMAMLLTFGMNITHNDFFCDCGLYMLTHVVRESILRYTRVEEFRYRCSAPAMQAGIDFLHDLSLDELVCNRTTVDNCPEGCLCQDRPHNDTFLVDCRNPAAPRLTEMPAVLPETHRSRIEMYLDNHFITSLRQAPYISKLYTLSMRNNLLNSLDSAILGNMTLNTGDFRNNQLKSIPKEVKKIGHVLLTGNPLECDCEITWIREWMEIDSTNADPYLTCLKKKDEHKIMDLELRDIGCTNELIIIISICLGVVLLGVIIVIVVIKRCPYESSVILHKFSGLHPFHKWRGDDDADKDVDLYLVFDESDTEVIGYIRYFTYMLEKKKPCYSILNPARFTEAGSQIDNVYKYIGKSRRVLVFLSKGIFENGKRIDEITDAEHRQVEAVTQQNVGSNSADDIRINIDDGDNVSVSSENSQDATPSTDVTKNAPKIIYILYNDEVNELVKEEPWKSRLSSKTVLRPDPDDKMFWAKMRYELPKNGHGKPGFVCNYEAFGRNAPKTAEGPRNSRVATQERPQPPKNPKLINRERNERHANTSGLFVHDSSNNNVARPYKLNEQKYCRPSTGSSSCSRETTSTMQGVEKINHRLQRLKNPDGKNSNRLLVFDHSTGGYQDGKQFFSRNMSSFNNHR